MKKLMLALTALLTPALLAAPAFASDFGDPDEVGGGGRYSKLVNAVGDLADVMEQVFAIMTSNPLLLVFLAAGLLSLGVWIFHKVKGVSK